MIDLQPERETDAPTTRLSRRAANAREISGILRLAWRSLGFGSIMLVAESCIVADPPEYRAPVQTRPVLNMYSAVPTATQALVLTTMPVSTTKFTVQVRSEDAGEDLRALFFLDYQLPTQRKLVSKVIPASTYDNTGRNFQADYVPVPKTDKGCHFLSLVVAHTSSFLNTIDDDRLDPRYANDDAAIATWTINVDPPSDGSLQDCPSRQAGP